MLRLLGGAGLPAVAALQPRRSWGAVLGAGGTLSALSVPGVAGLGQGGGREHWPGPVLPVTPALAERSSWFLVCS